MADRLGGSRRRGISVAAAAVALAFGLSGCIGSPMDPEALVRPVEGPLAEEPSANLQSLLDQAVFLSGSSGGVAGVWAPWAGEWAGASGTVDFGEGSPPVTTETGFHLATVTTEITCTVLLRLVDAGEVKLDDEVDDYLDRIPKLDDITLEQLCRHTSGLADYYPTLRSHFTANPERVWQPYELLSSGLVLDRVGPPGKQVHESRTGILLLALALERRTGKPWAELAEQYVFAPLGLDGTRIPEPAATDHPDTLGGYSAAIAADGSVDCAVLLDDSDQSSSMGGAAAGAVSTLEETRRLSETFATGSLFSEATSRRQWAAVQLGGPAPAWQAVGVGAMQYGPLRGVAGETAGALTAAFTDPESGLTVVVALNNSTPGADFVREVAFAMASIASKAEPTSGRERPLVELPWSVEQAIARMHEHAVCPRA